MLRINFYKKTEEAITGLGSVVKISTAIGSTSLGDLLVIRDICIDKAKEANESKIAAADSANKALASAQTASTASSNAANSAISANNSAGTASTKAAQATEAAATAIENVNISNILANQTAISAANAAASATEAADHAIDAYAYLLSAEVSASAAKSSETAAKASENNAVSAMNTAYDYSELARLSANAADASNAEAVAAADSAEASAVISTTKAQESTASANTAVAASTSATNSAAAAKSSEVAAKSSEVAAKSSEVAAKSSEVAAKSSETLSTTNAANAALDAVKANDARLAAEAAANSLVGGIVDKGTWDASTGTFPEKPTRPVVGGGTALVSAFWKVVVAGVVNSIDFKVGDDLRFSAGTDAFYKVDNTDAVSSVQGKVGVVVLSASEVGALATPSGTHTANTLLIAGDTAGTSKHSPFTVNKSVPADANFNDTVYTHPTTDGYKHVPANGTTNANRFLMAGAVAGDYNWVTLAIANVLGLDTALQGKLPIDGNAISASKLFTPVTINGVTFDGSADINISAASPNTLTRGTGLLGSNYNGGAATTWSVAYGTAAGTAAQGNDPRLSDARIPIAHNHAISDIVNLQNTLDSKYSSSNRPSATDVGALPLAGGVMTGPMVMAPNSTLDGHNTVARYGNTHQSYTHYYSDLNGPATQHDFRFANGAGSYIAYHMSGNGSFSSNEGRFYSEGFRPTADALGVLKADYKRGTPISVLYGTTNQSMLGTKIRLPWTMHGGQMVCFTVRVYQSYVPYDIQFSGYLYTTPDNWYSPRAIVMAGGQAITARMGRDDDGRAYVWLEGGHYRGVGVFNVVVGYQEGDATKGWEILESDHCPNLSYDQVIYPPFSKHNLPSAAELGAVTKTGDTMSGQLVNTAAYGYKNVVSTGWSYIGLASGSNEAHIAFNNNAVDGGLANSLHLRPVGSSAGSLVLQPNAGMKHQTSHGYVTIGSENSSHCHYFTDRPNHWFNKDIKVQGEIYAGSDYSQRVYHTANKPTPTEIGAYGNGFATTVFNVRVDGDANTFYPVVIRYPHGFSQSSDLRIYKTIHDYAGGDGSFVLELKGMWSTGWGNTPGGSCTSYAQGDLNKFIARMQTSGHADASYCIWLRGGGRNYGFESAQITPQHVAVHYSRVEISGSSGGYEVYADPTTTPIVDWGAINRVYHQGFKPTPVELGVLPISGGALTGNLHSGPGGFYPNSNGASELGNSGWRFREGWINKIVTQDFTSGHCTIAGQDIAIHGKRAVVGYSASDSLIFNFGGDFTGGTSVVGHLWADTIGGNSITGHSQGNSYGSCGIVTNGNSTNGRIPMVGFHQPGSYAGTIEMPDWATFRFTDQGRTGTLNVEANSYIAYGHLQFRPGDARSVIDFQNTGSSNDRGWIKHQNNSTGPAYMQFCVSDDPQEGSQDYFEFGAAIGNSTDLNAPFTQWVYIGSAGLTCRNNLTAYSDIRVKTDIQNIPNALEKVMKLNGVTYKRTDTGSDAKYTGVIAQEVEAVLPEAVVTTENGDIKDFKSVAYGNMVGLLIEAMKEQQKQIEELKQEINELKAR